MREQRVAVPLLEGVHSSVGALALRRTAEIGGIKCRVLLPGPHPGLAGGAGRLLTPPYDERHQQDPGWPKADWGFFNDDRSTSGTDDLDFSRFGLLGILSSGNGHAECGQSQAHQSGCNRF